SASTAARRVRAFPTRRSSDLLIEGDTETLALKAAQRALMGAGTRHVLDGSRKLIQQAARSDQTARGWVRITDGNPCAFCAMLATDRKSTRLNSSHVKISYAVF